MALHSYDANQVVVTYALVPIGNVAPDSFVDIDYNNDMHVLEIGCNQEAALYQTGDQSAKIKIRVLPNSFANLIFSAAMVTARAAKIGSFPLMILDLSSLTTHASPGAWILKPPRKVYAKNAEMLEWELETHQLECLYGHNPFNGGILG